jgi:hypothetical protein
MEIIFKTRPAPEKRELQYEESILRLELFSMGCEPCTL